MVKRGADSERRVVQLFVFVSQRIEEQYCQLMGISSLMTYWRNNLIVSFFSQELFSKSFRSTRIGFVGIFPYSGLRYGNIKALHEAGFRVNGWMSFDENESSKFTSRCVLFAVTLMGRHDFRITSMTPYRITVEYPEVTIE